MPHPPDAPLELVAADADPRQRADRLVVALLARAGRPATRADVQRWMAEDRVRIDGQPARRAQPVRAGARIWVLPGAALRTEARPDPSVPFTLVYEDDALLVVDKPAGVVVHPARGHWSGTLVSGLLARASRGGEDAVPLGAPDPRDPTGHLRPGIVHRLDKDTSGLLVVAKTARCRELLQAAFARHDLERRYAAIVVGKARAASFDTPYGRHPHSRLRFTSRLPPDRPHVRRAVTHVQPVEQLGGAALVRCTLETGRTHQIRVHLAEQAGTPVLGDKLYAEPPRDRRLRELGEQLGRQALHAELLGFRHPLSGELVRWQSELPADLQALLAALRS